MHWNRLKKELQRKANQAESIENNIVKHSFAFEGKMSQSQINKLQ